MKKDPPTKPDDGGEEDSTKRHVYVEPGVQIDLVKDLKQKYEAAQSDSTIHSNKILFWTKTSAALLFIYAGLTWVQSCQAIKSARAAKSAADTANKALHISERAYISNSLPALKLEKRTVEWDIVNTGHIPCKRGDLSTQSIVMNRANRTSPWHTDECHVHRTVDIKIASGTVNARDIVLLRTMSKEAIEDGVQKLIIVGAFSYNDGFDEDPTETTPICFESVYYSGVKQIDMSSCGSLGQKYYLSQSNLFVNCEDDTNIRTKPED
jgi:hypothetical protein